MDDYIIGSYCLSPAVDHHKVVIAAKIVSCRRLVLDDILMQEVRITNAPKSTPKGHCLIIFNC
jgi:hypothetical protein